MAARFYISGENIINAQLFHYSLGKVLFPIIFNFQFKLKRSAGSDFFFKLAVFFKVLS